jgi:hypothetical protein
MLVVQIAQNAAKKNKATYAFHARPSNAMEHSPCLIQKISKAQE